MFSFFRKKKIEPTYEQQKWNQLCNLYCNGLEELNKDMYILFEYDNGINGEGHSCFFSNNEEELHEYADSLKKTLPPKLFDSFIKAYNSYNTDNEVEACDAADDYFNDHEQEIIEILQGYANSL